MQEKLERSRWIVFRPCSYEHFGPSAEGSSTENELNRACFSELQTRHLFCDD